MTTEAAHRAILDAFFSTSNDAQRVDAGAWLTHFEQKGAGVLPCRRGNRICWLGLLPMSGELVRCATSCVRSSGRRGAPGLGRAPNSIRMTALRRR